MGTNISITKITILFHAICTNRKVTRKAMKHFTILYNSFMEITMSLLAYILLIDIGPITHKEFLCVSP